MDRGRGKSRRAASGEIEGVAKFVERADKRTIDLKKSKRKFKKKEKKVKTAKTLPEIFLEASLVSWIRVCTPQALQRINERGERTLTNLRDDAEESEKDVGANVRRVCGGAKV